MAQLLLFLSVYLKVSGHPIRFALRDFMHNIGFNQLQYG